MLNCRSGIFQLILMRSLESIPIGANLNLVIQLMVLVLLLFGAKLAKAGRFESHSKLMKTAIILQVGTLVLWMGPSLVLNTAAFYTFGPGQLITILHVAIGYIALLLAVSAALHKTIISLKWTMRATFLVWTLAAIFGVGFYVYYYLLG